MRSTKSRSQLNKVKRNKLIVIQHEKLKMNARTTPGSYPWEIIRVDLNPVLQTQALNPLELFQVISDQRETLTSRMPSNMQIVHAYG